MCFYLSLSDITLWLISVLFVYLFYSALLSPIGLSAPSLFIYSVIAIRPLAAQFCLLAPPLVVVLSSGFCVLCLLDFPVSTLACVLATPTLDLPFIDFLCSDLHLLLTTILPAPNKYLLLSLLSASGSSPFTLPSQIVTVTQECENTLSGERRRVELKPFCLYTTILGQWREEVHKDRFPGYGVEEGGSGVTECALSN